jgi:hypothetical protein
VLQRPLSEAGVRKRQKTQENKYANAASLDFQ